VAEAEYPYENTEQSQFGFLPLGHAKQDIEVQLKLNAEAFRLTCPEVRYIRLDRETTVVDSLYKEYVGGPKWAEPVLVPVVFQHNPAKNLLKKIGIEEEQDGIATFCVRICDELGIKPTTGDRIEYLDVPFEILSVKYIDYLQGSQVPLNLVATLKNSNPL
jgi:hypothetical protein